MQNLEYRSLAQNVVQIVLKNCALGAIHKVRHTQGAGCPGKRYEALQGGGGVWATFVIKTFFFVRGSFGICFN